MSIEIPAFDSAEPADADVDGFTLQAIRIAADDFLGHDRADSPCWERQTAHRYRALRQGDIVFVRIHYKPENCGDRVGALGGSATYAIGVDGRILRIQPY